MSRRCPSARAALAAMLIPGNERLDGMTARPHDGPTARRTTARPHTHHRATNPPRTDDTEQIMSMFKQFGDMAKMVKAAPGLIAQADTLAAQSEAYRAQMDAQAVHAMTATAAPSNLEPIAGVDLDRYARIVKGIAAYHYDEAKLPVVAGMFGVGPTEWAEAQAGWGARIQADRGVGRRFNELYSAV